MDRLDDVLELGRAEIADRHLEPSFDLPIGLLGKADRAGLGDTLEPRGDIHAVAHEIAVALFDNVAQVDADAELDAPLGRQARVALDHAGLHFDSAAHGVHNTPELDDRAIAGALHNASVMNRDDGIDQIAAKRPQPRKNAILVRSREPAIADNVRNQNRRNLPGLAHGAPPAGGSISQNREGPHLSD